MSPAQQKQQIMHVLLTTLLRIAAQQPVLFVMEDLHWVDPTTLEFLTLLVDQGPTARILALLTFRPDFSPPWAGRSHLTQVTLPRLPRRQATAMMDQVAHGKALPPEVVAQVVAKTDGVPLFVEELTKMVLESGLLQEQEDRYALTGPLPPLAIPSTLHDSLMARLDRLATVKSLAQLGATLGREFPYALLHAVSPWDEETLRRGLHQLVEAEFLYQQGLPPQATYLFKHALIQEAAYQSLLKSTRQQYHQRVAQVLEAQFPDTAETQPELLAHHYAEAGLLAQALPYWQQAGQRALQRSAHLEAMHHLTRGLEVLAALPETPERTQHELVLQLTLGPALMALKGQAAPEVGQAYARARELCRQVGETPQLFPILLGLWRFYLGARSIRRRGNWRSNASAWPSGSTTRRSSCSPFCARGDLTLAVRSSRRAPTWSRGLRSTIPRSIAPWPSAPALTWGVVPVPPGAGPVGARVSGPGAAAQPRSAHPGARSCPIPRAWRLPCSMRPSSTGIAGRPTRPRSGPRPPWRWRVNRDCHSG